MSVSSGNYNTIWQMTIKERELQFRRQKKSLENVLLFTSGNSQKKPLSIYLSIYLVFIFTQLYMYFIYPKLGTLPVPI